MSAGFQRMLTGQNVFISDYSYNGPDNTKGMVCLGTSFPAKILRLNVDEYGGNRLSIHLANLSLTFLQKRSEEIPTLGDDISFDQT